MFKVQCSKFNVYFVDFCHDSANHASMLALAAPKVHLFFLGVSVTSGIIISSMEMPPC